MLDTQFLKKTFQNEYDEILEDYFTFLRFQSISTDPHYRSQVDACADWLVQTLQKIGLQVEKWQGEGPSVIFATDLRAGKHKETLLLYCHYDVQPIDPIELWTTPPFEPTIRDGKVYARGAADNKGQCFYTIRAIKTLLENFSTLPVNLKFIIEGEEESGSLALYNLLDGKKEQLKADHVLIVDAGLEKAGEPAICLGARGLTCLTVTLTGSRFDLHSGTHGGIVYNPNRALVELLASLHDNTNTVKIPGFYDEVVEILPSEKHLLSSQFDPILFEKEFGAKPLGIERGLTPQEAAWLRPTLEINGIAGGYAGPGFKTVIPSKAMAKISCRLVPRQDPVQISKLVKEYLVSHVHPEIAIDVIIHKSYGIPFRTNPHSRIAKLLSHAYSEVFQKPCTNILLGGSIPVAADLAKTAGADMILIGVGLSTDQIHAPDEHFSLDRLEQGYLILCNAIQNFHEK